MARGQAAQNLRTVKRRIEKVCDDGVAEAGVAVAARSREVGKRFAGARMGARVEVLGPGHARIKGVPAGYWSILTYGRGAVRPRQRRALTIGANVRAAAGPAGPIPARSWRRVEDFADDIVPATFTDLTREALNG